MQKRVSKSATRPAPTCRTSGAGACRLPSCQVRFGLRTRPRSKSISQTLPASSTSTLCALVRVPRARRGAQRSRRRLPSPAAAPRLLRRDRSTSVRSGDAARQQIPPGSPGRHPNVACSHRSRHQLITPTKDARASGTRGRARVRAARRSEVAVAAQPPRAMNRLDGSGAIHSSPTGVSMNATWPRPALGAPAYPRSGVTNDRTNARPARRQAHGRRMIAPSAVD